MLFLFFLHFSSCITYTVQPGDTLYGIAVRFDITLDDLIELNGIEDPNLIYVGQILIISNDDDSLTVLYVVKEGDTLQSIADKFEVSAQEIVHINKISTPNDIYVGQNLKIPVISGSSKTCNGYTAHGMVKMSQMLLLGWTSITQEVLDDLNKCLAVFEIQTSFRIRHFLSQCSQESGSGKYTKEIASGEQYENRTDLGNTEPGDGPRYKGAGFIQLTGRYNYQQFADYVGDPDVMIGVDYVAEKYPFTSAGFWWMANKMNSLCDTNPSVEQVTRVVNGGYNGLEARKYYFDLACGIF